MQKLRPDAHHLGVAPSCNALDVVMFPSHKWTNAVANQAGATLEIHCGPLSFYLDKLGVRHIDSIDFDNVQIDVILAESVNLLEGKTKMAEEVRTFLGQRGYLLLVSVMVFHSDVFLLTRVCHRYDFPECTPFSSPTYCSHADHTINN